MSLWPDLSATSAYSRWVRSRARGIISLSGLGRDWWRCRENCVVAANRGSGDGDTKNAKIQSFRKDCASGYVLSFPFVYFLSQSIYSRRSPIRVCVSSRKDTTLVLLN